jgi:hypothetical protein
MYRTVLYVPKYLSKNARLYDMLRSSLHIVVHHTILPITPLKHDSDNRKSPLLCSQCRRNCTAMREFPQISSNPVNEESFYQRFSHPRQFRWFNVVSVVQRGRDSPRVDQIRQNYGRDGRSWGCGGWPCLFDARPGDLARIGTCCDSGGECGGVLQNRKGETIGERHGKNRELG